ncbi:MAG: GNAT family N-acetyltransferase [Natronospirillum sp.]
MGITAPSLLSSGHDLTNFKSGNPSLDDWLVKQAQKNQDRGFSRVYVVTEGNAHSVVGYYAVAMGSIQRSEAMASLRRNSPEAIPMVVLGRLAVDNRYHGRGIGAGLLKDCVIRSAASMAAVGGAGLLVHAIDDAAVSFYTKFGFTPSPLSSRTLMARIKDIQASL